MNTDLCTELSKAQKKYPDMNMLDLILYAVCKHNYSIERSILNNNKKFNIHEFFDGVGLDNSVIMDSLKKLNKV